jgi:hypothetical protein
MIDSVPMSDYDFTLTLLLRVWENVCTVFRRPDTLDL